MPSLSESFIKSAQPFGDRHRVVFDSHRDAPRGFGLKVTKAGWKSFVLRYRPKDTGRERQVTIGQWPTWSLASAREEATKLKRDIDRGADILEKRRLERRKPYLGVLVEDYCTEMVDKLKSGPQVRSVLERYLVEGLGAKTKLAEVRRADVRSEIHKLATRAPRQAALLLTYTKGFFAWAEDGELIDVNPVATLKPAKVDKRMSNKNFVRGRVLEEVEIADFWQAVESCGMHRLTALALKFILVTGQRPGEVSGLHRREIKGDLWTIPAERRGKTNTAHVVPLTKLAQNIIEDARAEVARLSKRRSARPSGHIFEARPGAGLTVNAIDRAVTRFAGALKIKDIDSWGHWTPHDLRRTCRTGLSAAGVNEVVAELTIGHTRKGIAAVYDLHKFDTEKRRALEAWERKLRKIIAGGGTHDSGNVIEAHFGN